MHVVNAFKQMDLAGRGHITFKDFSGESRRHWTLVKALEERGTNLVPLWP